MTKTYIRVKNWDEYQHYKDRHAPWIKFYGNMLTSEWWIMGTDDSKLLAVCIMALAQRNDNKIPADIEYIKRFSHIASTPDISALVDSQFIELIDENEVVQDASNVQAECKQRAPRIEKNREDKNTSPQGKPAKFDFLAALIEKGASTSSANDFMATRKTKKLTPTETAFKGIVSEVEKSGMAFPSAIDLCCRKGWGGFEAGWLKPEDKAIASAGAYDPNEMVTLPGGRVMKRSAIEWERRLMA